MALITSSKPSDWTRRINRARDLAEQSPSAKEVLNFYSHVLEFQKAVYEQVPDNAVTSHFGNLRDSIDPDVAARHLPALLDLVLKFGPTKLSEKANDLRSTSPDTQRGLLESALRDPKTQDGGEFFFRVVLQPLAERCAQASDIDAADPVGAICPRCESLPELAVIRPEGDGGKRSLICSFCQTEWEFRRIVCPACGEENNEKLPRYSAEGIAAVRVESCETCRCYLKSVDLTVDGLAIPLVDEISTAVLDLWATEHGYQKLHLNIVGF